MLARAASAIRAEMTIFMTFLHLRTDADDTLSPLIGWEEHALSA